MQMFLLFLLLNTYALLEANEPPIDSKPIVISLGFNCVAADMLRKYKVREFASPFDWIYSSLSGVCQCIDDKFQDFLNPKYLTVDDSAILNTKYILSFFHDFPEEPKNGRNLPAHNWQDSIEEIAIKYNRRIKRFCETMNSGRTIYLIRTPSLSYWPLDRVHQDRHAIEKLRDCISRAFPNANFTIIAISHDPSYMQDWKLDRIRNFHFHNITSESEWKIMLQNMLFI